MRAARLPFRAYVRLFRRHARDERGIAAVEFSLILPMLILLWIGGVEVTEALSVDRRLNNLASSVGDLIARDKVVTYAEITSIFNLGPKAMYPACKSAAECTGDGLGIRVTAVDMNGAGSASIAWTQETGNLLCAPVVSMNITVPLTLRVPDTQIIMAEVCYTYTPAVGYMITGPISLTDRMFFVPRLVNKVQRCASDPPPTTCQS